MSVGDARTLRWLLQDDEPSVRYLTQTTLLGQRESDPEVRLSRTAIGVRGWAAEILRDQRPDGRWTTSDSLYVPKYHSTNWQLLVLSDLGVTRADPRIARACEVWMKEFQKADGGFAPGGWRSHLCTTGNCVRALIRFGYGGDRRVRRGLDWLVANQAKLGGWSCWGPGMGRNLDSWEPMSAFAAYPRSRWTTEMQRAVERGAEFFLSRELHKQGPHYEPWYRFHYPAHYYYDLLVGLDFMTGLGYAREPRLGHALGVLRKKRGRDRRWRLDAVHPDAEGSVRAWWDAHPNQRPIPLALEKVGKPSKMITLRALKVLARVEAAA